MRRHIAAVISFSLLLSSCAAGSRPGLDANSDNTSSSPEAAEFSSSAPSASGQLPTRGMPEGKKAPLINLAQALDTPAFGGTTAYRPSQIVISPEISKNFTASQAQNLAAIKKAYGISLSDKEQKFLNDNKFLIINLLDTAIRPVGSGDKDREFAALYRAVSGDTDYKNRLPENAVFYSSDIFMHLYPLLLTELMKEMENTEFAPAMLRVSKSFFDSANAKIAGGDNGETIKWKKIRNYFAVPYAILSNVQGAPQSEDYIDANGNIIGPDTVQADFKSRDATVDTFESAAEFVKTLKLDAESEQTVISDLKNIYAAEGNGPPEVFRTEFEQYKIDTEVEFKIDFTQFTPRSHYTGTSLRRQYFRAMTWFIQVPFFLKSGSLTDTAFGIARLMSENPQALADYSRMESAIRFIVGVSDDLMPVDYLAALESAKGVADQEKAVMDYLVKARIPKIKNISAAYTTIGDADTDEVILLTKGMRLFSGKFIIDSSWTQRLTQGDEKPRPGYSQKLPPMASSLEVMALLGSDYAKSRISTLDFYKPGVSKAIDQALQELAAESGELSDADWQESLYSASLWSIQSLFGWLEQNKQSLPAFMKSPLWDVKTLQTASGLWTEMRHATLLYAKQSFAELGGGGGSCDRRPVPPPPMGYIEPNVELYDRLIYLASRTNSGLTEQGFELNNLYTLGKYIDVLTIARDYSVKELANRKFEEKVIQNEYPDYTDPESGKPEKCIQNEIEGQSEPEQIRRLIEEISSALPSPVEGPIVPAKDRRTALLADVHTGGDSSYPTRVLYQGIGVPQAIIVLVKDANGLRATIGFVYSHYEFTELYGGKRLTDEDWQKNFYNPTDDPYSAYDYTGRETWPTAPSWYDSILKVK